MEKNNEIVIFKPEQGADEFRIVLDGDQDTVWATKLQIADIFGKDRTGVSRHMKNIFKEGELDEKATSAIFAQVQKEGDREVYRDVSYYNLDVIGYRVKSKVATEFRKWATRKLKEYLIQGYSLNERLLVEKNERITLLESKINSLNEIAFQQQKNLTDGFLDIVSIYSKSFELLNKYDSDDLNTNNLNKEVIYVINYSDVKKAIEIFKRQLIDKGEVTELFGNEKDDSFSGILGSISQTVFGELAYPTIEEQAA